MLIPDFNHDIPESTAEVARAAFPKGNPYLTLRDELGTIFADEDFVDLFPERGQPALSPWRLALVTILQFRENLPDRQAADAVRSRIDWKYLLGLELSDPGFDFSVLSEFRDRLLQGGAEELLLDNLLERCLTLGLVKAGGRQRTDSTRVLAAIREVNRLELVGETLRAALNQLAVEAPEWLRSIAPSEWYERYGRRIEDQRLPQSKTKRMELTIRIGADGFMLLDALAAPGAPEGLGELAQVQVLESVWQRHYERRQGKVHFLAQSELSSVSEAVESPYDPEARYRKRAGKKWVGYFVHLSESCDDDMPHLLTNTHTTTASVHEALCTKLIQQKLVDKGLTPEQHLTDSAYVNAELLVSSPQEQGIRLVGPAKGNHNWQSKVEGAYDDYQFEIDWEKEQVRCPQGKLSISWREYIKKDDHRSFPYIRVRFGSKDCRSCSTRHLCTRGKMRTMNFQPQLQYEALRETRLRMVSKDGNMRRDIAR